MKSAVKQRAARKSQATNQLSKKTGNRKTRPSALEEKKPLGRPTDYKPEYCRMMLDYFDIEVQKVVDIEIPDGKGGMSKESKAVTNTYPTLERFAFKIGVARQTLHNWANAKKPDGTPVHPDFFDAYTRARDLQAALLIEGGMAGLYDSKFACLAAKNIAGWRDQVEQTIETNITMTPVEELDAIYDAAMKKAKEQKEAMIARSKALWPDKNA